MLLDCRLCCSFSCENAGKSKTVYKKENCFLNKPDRLKDFAFFLKNNCERYNLSKKTVSEVLELFDKARFKG